MRVNIKLEFLQSNFVWVRVIGGTNDYDTLQFNVAGKWDVEQQFSVHVTFDILTLDLDLYFCK